MTRKRIIQLDAETGEVAGEFVAYVARARRNYFGQEGWMAMAQSPAMALAQSGLRGDDFRVLLALVSKLDYENLIQVNQRELAEALGMKQPNVSRAIRHLVEHEVVLLGPKIGTRRSYRMNPRYGWKGSAKNHRTAIDEDLEQRLAASGITGVIEGGVGSGEPPPPERNPNTGDPFDEPPT